MFTPVRAPQPQSSVPTTSIASVVEMIDVKKRYIVPRRYQAFGNWSTWVRRVHLPRTSQKQTSVYSGRAGQMCYALLVNDANERAERRRRTYKSEIVSTLGNKPRLREASFTQERLGEMWQLCVTQWCASGRELASFERATMPGEAFRIET